MMKYSKEQRKSLTFKRINMLFEERARKGDIQRKLRNRHQQTVKDLVQLISK